VCETEKGKTKRKEKAKVEGVNGGVF